MHVFIKRFLTWFNWPKSQAILLAHAHPLSICEKECDFHALLNHSPFLLRNVVAIGLCFAMPLSGQAHEGHVLTALSLEELMEVEVTLASRKEERIFNTAAAVFVIAQEDIHRSGATSIPEVLRLVPGLQVARLDANKWAISARGFNSRYAQKLLVLIDGRNIYSSIFSGVFWEVEDVMLEDVDRIEVIRGPGATLWGTNAVNGIINIITKSAHDTQGGLAVVGTGSEERGFGQFRYGLPVGKHAFARVFGKYFNRDAFVDSTSQTAADDWHMFRTGFRYDWQTGPHQLTTQGAFYQGKTGETFEAPTLIKPFKNRLNTTTKQIGSHLLARWEHTSGLTVQTYYDRARRTDDVSVLFSETYDFDLQHHFALGNRQDMVWGLGYRVSRDKTEGVFKVSFDPPNRTLDLYSAFLQNDFRLVKDRLALTLGSKFEHNDFTGFEYQPNMRLLWTPNNQQTLWAAITRAVRTPARSDDDIKVVFHIFALEDIDPNIPVGAPPLVAFAKGMHDFDSEKIVAYELGYRLRPSSTFYVDIAGFYNVYENLRAGQALTPFVLVTSQGPVHFEATSFIDNLMAGRAHGFESVVDWHLLDNRVRLRWAYTYLSTHLTLEPGALPESRTVANNNPKHQFYVRSSFDLPNKIQFDSMLRYVDALPERITDTMTPYAHLLPKTKIDSYIELDLRLGWHLSHSIEVAAIGQNLLHAHHPEITDLVFGTVATQTQRGIYGTIVYSFDLKGKP